MSQTRTGSRGFTLIEVMIATAILGTVSAALITLIGTITRSQVDLTLKLDAIESLNFFNAVLLDEEACKNTFTNCYPSSGCSTAALKNNSKTTLVAIGPGKPIAKAELRPSVEDPNQVADLTLTFTAKGSSIPLAPKKVKLKITKTSAGLLDRWCNE